MNRILSFRQDVRWRKFAVSRIGTEAKLVLDVATGTGDLALEMVKKYPRLEVVGLDFVEKMLLRAREKALKISNYDRIQYLMGDALTLPFADNAFDSVIMGFGLRNIPQKLEALKEMARVVKLGGKVLILEMTYPKNLKFRKFFNWYFRNIIPLWGKIIAHNQNAYQYLTSSVQNFLHPEELTELFYKADLKNVRAFPMTGGIAYLHEGIVRRTVLF
jgi:demethylmenaquinone methyltransferase/2-methoxy-6-polyprenyl-1,4-benzoquinol methylase